MTWHACTAPPTAAAYLTAWLAHKTGTVAPSTARTYRHAIEELVAAYGDRPLAAVTAHDIEELAYTLLLGTAARRPLSPSRVFNRRGVWQAAFADAVAAGLRPDNPTDGLRLPRRHPRGHPAAPDIAYWNSVDLARFLHATAAEPLQAVWALVAGTGLRACELAALRWTDVDLDGATSHVRRAWAPPATPVRPAGPWQDRSLAVPMATVAALRRHRDQPAVLAHWQATAVKGWTDLVFDAGGSPLDPGPLAQSLDQRAATLGLPAIGLRGLRHSHAVLLVGAAVPLAVVRTRLGLSSLAHAYGAYAPLLPVSDADAAHCCDRLLTPAA